MASTAWPTVGKAAQPGGLSPPRPLSPARPPALSLTADAVALPEGHEHALVVRAQHQVQREAEGLLGLGPRRVVVQLVNKPAGLVHHEDAEDGHRGTRRPGGEGGSPRLFRGRPEVRSAAGFPACADCRPPFQPEAAQEEHVAPPAAPCRPKTTRRRRTRASPPRRTRTPSTSPAAKPRRRSGPRGR